LNRQGEDIAREHDSQATSAVRPDEWRHFSRDTKPSVSTQLLHINKETH
jgi:hypothetical protein